MRRSVLLYEPRPYAHASTYLDQVIYALPSEYSAIAAAPTAVLSSLRAPHIPCEVNVPAAKGRRGLLEVRLFRKLIADLGPATAIYMSADAVIPELSLMPQLTIPHAAILFRPRLRADRGRGIREALKDVLQSRLLAYWMDRGDATVLLTLDDRACRSWTSAPGSAVAWLPEPPLPECPSDDVGLREGVILYGALSARKGLERLVDALVSGDRELGSHRLVRLAGLVAAEYQEDFGRGIARLRDAGVEVEIHDRWVDSLEAHRLLRMSKLCVLPYVRHRGMSRVLLEAAAAYTPVVAHDYGLVGDLVRRFQLGAAVDCTRPATFSQAIAAVEMDPPSAERFERFVARYDGREFARVVRSAVEVAA